MNIFAVNLDPTIAAKELPDIYTGSGKYGGKMIVETAQMLANAYSLQELVHAPYTKKGTPRKHSYMHHPCSKWAIDTLENFAWLLIHGLTLCNEKIRRGGNVHFTESFIVWCSKHPPNIGSFKLTDFVMAMPAEFKTNDPVISYQKYLTVGKAHLNFTWTDTQIPSWYKGATNDLLP